MNKAAIEELAARLHTVYVMEAYRQGDVRHADRYEDLPEHTKDFDRALARWIVQHFVDRSKVEEALRGLPCWQDDFILEKVLEIIRRIL